MTYKASLKPTYNAGKSKQPSGKVSVNLVNSTYAMLAFSVKNVEQCTAAYLFGERLA